MAGKVSKTNSGTQIETATSAVSAGSPNLSKEISLTGEISDIRLADPLNGGSAGVFIKISFDKSEFNSNRWFKIRNGYEEIMATYGDRNAILKSKPRILYRCKQQRFFDGVAEIISDNRDEFKYLNYPKNKSNSFVTCIGGLISGAKYIG